MTDPWLLVFPHRDRLVRLARRRLDSLADAEDVASEAMLRVATFPALDHGRVGEMLTSVTVRLCTDLLRHRAVQREKAPRLADLPTDPLADLLDAFEARWLAEVPLTRVERTLLMARVHGLYPSEVAASLGLTLPAAKSALVRARRKLTAAWKATLGVLGLSRLRRLLPAGAAVAVALAVAVLGPLARPERPTPTAAVREPVEAPRRRAVPVAPVSSPSAAPAVVDVTPPVTPPAAVVVTVPPMDGPVWHKGVTVQVDTSEDPVSRVRRCVEKGVEVALSQASVTCRE